MLSQLYDLFCASELQTKLNRKCGGTE